MGHARQPVPIRLAGPKNRPGNAARGGAARCLRRGDGLGTDLLTRPVRYCTAATQKKPSPEHAAHAQAWAVGPRSDN